MDTLNQKRVWSGLGSVLFVSLLACLFTACNDKIDVQQAFPFTVETMPVPTRLVLGETAEIRCELKRAGRFEDARYTIRYFQPDGKGSLLLDNGMKLLPNDRYPLDREVFRLYYTSGCTDQQTIDIYFEDNAGQVALLSFSFNNENEEEEEAEVTEKCYTGNNAENHGNKGECINETLFAMVERTACAGDLTSGGAGVHVLCAAGCRLFVLLQPCCADPAVLSHAHSGRTAQHRRV